MGILENLLPTPRAGNPGSRPNKKGGKILAEQIALLPTPTSGGRRSKNSKQQGINNVIDRLSLLADSLANPSPVPEKEKEQAMTAISGQKFLELYNLQNPNGSLRKMCEALLTSKTAWYSNKCALTWKVKVTKSNRLLFQLSSSMRRTEGIGSGLLPTARVLQGNGASQKEIVAGNPKRRLETEIAMLPTPGVMDIRSDIRKPEERSAEANKGGCSNLRERIGNSTGAMLRLQPAMCEWMMGYPSNWTDLNLPKLNTEIGRA